MERTDLEQWKAKEVARLLALVETERRYYQEMVAMLPVALVVLSADRSVSSANRAFRQTFGLRSKDMRGKTIEQILPSDRSDRENSRSSRDRRFANRRFRLEHDGRNFTVGIVPIRNWDDESEIETLLMLQEAGEAENGRQLHGSCGGFRRNSGDRVGSGRGDARVSFRAWRRGADAWLYGGALDGHSTVLRGTDPSGGSGIDAGVLSRRLPADQAMRARSFASLRHRVERCGCARRSRVTGGVHDGRDRRRSSAASSLKINCCAPGARTRSSGMASRLAHDLNNPLMIVTGYAEEMRNSSRRDDPMRGDVDQILTATDRISGITAQLLNYTRRQANPASPVNVAQMLGADGREDRARGGRGLRGSL